MVDRKDRKRKQVQEERDNRDKWESGKEIKKKRQELTILKIILITVSYICLFCVSGFGGAEVACWPLIPKFVGSNPVLAVGFLQGDKNPQHAFLRKGSKIIGPMSQICGM